ncbi:MAG TPA: N-acetylglucosamine-6-phosphate deacetylase [Acidimicrobiales bacterium]|nr:N-acetylglucosamine-6-phosphate deacetylase [Acidimicrobiales bacterium]
MTKMVLTGCRIVLDKTIVEHGWLSVDGAHITGVGEGHPPSAAGHGEHWAVIGLAGATLVPGFIDLHGHGGGGRSFQEADVGAAAAAVGLHRRHGTTSQLASVSTCPPEQMLSAISCLAGAASSGLISGTHLEGPFLSHERRGAHDPNALRTPDPSLMAEFLAAGLGTVRVVTIAPELPGALGLIEMVAAAGVVPAVGHTDATEAEARAGFDAGARLATHLFNGMRPLRHRDPGVVAAAVEDERVFVEVIVDGYHLADSAVRLAHRLVGRDRLVLVTDAMAGAGVGDGRYALGGRVVDVRNGRATLADSSSLAGSTLTMDRALAGAVRAGLSLLDASRAASWVPARVLGLGAGRGTLAPGQRADLVALDQAGRTQAVMLAGEWLLGPDADGQS